MKVSIIGHNGSGKTSLSTQIANKLDLPRLELDRLWFIHGGAAATTKTQKDTTHERTETAVEHFLDTHDSWVIDGIYGGVQKQISTLADQIIFIDIRLPRRLYNHLTRWWRNTDRHNELTRYQDFMFLLDMLRKTRKYGPRIAAILQSHPQKVTVLSSYEEVESYLSTLKK